MKASVLLLGLGNDVLSDDAIGLMVVRSLREELAAHRSITVTETTEMGLALLDFMEGYRSVLIVDSIQTGEEPAGSMREFDAAELERTTGRTPHFLGVGETLALGRTLGIDMPDCVRILAVEVEDPFTLATVLTPKLQEALPGAIARAKELVLAMAETRESGGGSNSGPSHGVQH